MTTSRWLIGLDVDGTILLEDESPSPGVFDAVARLRDQGDEVMIATGRSWASTDWIVDRLGIRPEYVVCSNGAVTMRRTDEGSYERFHVESFDPSEVLGLLYAQLPEARYMVESWDGSRRFTGHLDGWLLEGGEQVEFAELSRDAVSRVVVVAPEHDESDFQRLVARVGLNEVSYAIGWTAWLDIAPKGVNKGTAMARVRDALGGWDGERVLVAGDGRNDLEMFTWARSIGGRAVAMGQAPDEVRGAAAETTADVISGGLATVLSGLVRESAGEASA